MRENTISNIIKDITKRIKECFSKATDADKFMLWLCALLIITNIFIIVWSDKKSNELQKETEYNIERLLENENKVFKEDVLEELHSVVENLKKYAISITKYIITIIVSIISYYLSLIVGKVLGFFENIVEFITDLGKDCCFFYLVALYNMIGITLDVYTLISFIYASVITI